MTARRAVLLACAAAGAISLARAARGVPTALGARPSALRGAAASSPRAVGGLFRNTLPGDGIRGGLPALARALIARGRTGRPARPVPLAPVDVPAVAGPLALTWYGHSSVLLEIDGRRVLADPVWSERASPSRRIGPRRMHPVPVPLAGVPVVDVVLISHDHYDHLDVTSVRALVALSDAPFVVPVGVGAHLRAWGVPSARIVERDWNGSVEIAGLTLTCTEARHFSGRALTRNTTQWSSWVVAGPRHRVFFGGDTGYSPAFAEIGARLGPFDLTLVPIGAYADLWPDMHMTPEEAVRAHADLQRGDAGHGLLAPVHWATFNLGFHTWAEPVERLVAAAAPRGVALAVPRPGERIDAECPGGVGDWWSPVT